MASPAVEIRHLLSSGQVSLGAAGALHSPAVWGLAELAGRLVELVGSDRGSDFGTPSAAWTAATSLVLDAQCLGEPVVWVARPGALFFPPDVASNGVDLAGLAVVRVESSEAMLRAADYLLRSGAFGLVVLDLGIVRGVSGGGVSGGGVDIEIPLPAQVRLAGLAKKHDTALVCLSACLGARGSFASLRAVSVRERAGEGRFSCSLKMVKDKRRGWEWECAQVLRGPMGLR